MARKKQMEAKMYRFRVPVADAAVTEWLASQENVSVSLRVLIRAAIQQNGYADVLCSDPLGEPRKPRKIRQVSRPAIETVSEEADVQTEDAAVRQTGKKAVSSPVKGRGAAEADNVSPEAEKLLKTPNSPPAEKAEEDAGPSLDPDEILGGFGAGNSTDDLLSSMLN